MQKPLAIQRGKGGLGNSLKRLGQPGGGGQKSENHIWVLRVGPQGSQQNTWDQVHGCRGRQKPDQLEAKPRGPQWVAGASRAH